jgi:hypothetical protein
MKDSLKEKLNDEALNEVNGGAGRDRSSSKKVVTQTITTCQQATTILDPQKVIKIKV